MMTYFKKNILIICNVGIYNNPALTNIINDLKGDFNLELSGNIFIDNNIYNGIPYSNHEIFYQQLIKFKILQLLAIPYALLFKNGYVDRASAKQDFLLKFKIRLSAIALKRRLYKPQFIVNIDTEAAVISQESYPKQSVPSCVFIYEMYADQFLTTKDKGYDNKVMMEKNSIKFTSFILCTCNKATGDFLNSRYGLMQNVINYTICFENFSQPLSVKNEISFYYHGVYAPNRGLDNALLAMKEVDGGKLYMRGVGEYGQYLKNMVVENMLTDKVTFLEPLRTEELASAAAEFDLGLTLANMNVLNHKYATGFKTFQNLSAGLALILPASVPLKEMNEQYNVGMTYNDATVNELAEIFSFCTKNPQQVIQWKKNARRAYDIEYNPTIQKERLIENINKNITAN